MYSVFKWVDEAMGSQRGGGQGANQLQIKNGSALESVYQSHGIMLFCECELVKRGPNQGACALSRMTALARAFR